MKNVLLIVALSITMIGFIASQDQIYFHSGHVANSSVIKLDAMNVEYSYTGETAVLIVSKYAVDRIVFSSGRSLNVTDKITVNDDDDWENVVVLTDLSETAGLKRVKEVRGKSHGLGSTFQTAAGNEDSAYENLLEEVADLKCQFVLITDKMQKMGSDGSIGLDTEKQVVKRGIAYSYSHY